MTFIGADGLDHCICDRLEPGVRRKLLGRFGLDDQVEQSIDDSGMLELCFAEARADATAFSEDGNQTVAWLSPSGEIAAVLVQDYINGESRIIRFGFGDIEITNDGSEISVFLLA
jgi:hypothetical protein